MTARLIATAIVLVAVVSFAVAAVTTIALRQFLYQRLDDQLVEASADVGTGFGPPGVYTNVCAVINAGFGFRGASGTLNGSLDPGCRRAVVLEGPSNLRVLDDNALDELDALPTQDKPQTVDLGSAGEFRVIVDEDAGHTVVVGLPTEDVHATIARLIGWEALVAVLSVLAAAVAASTLVRRQLRPLNEVAATASAVAQLPLERGEVGVTARLTGDLTDPETEVGQVGFALNKLLSHVESALDARHESEQQVRQFVADASHELRTPLATIQGYAELTRRSDADAGAYAHAMSKVETESARMATLVDDLLLLARLDAGRPLGSGEVDLSLLVAEAVNDARVVDGDRRYRLDLPDEPLQVTGDEQRLHQALSNLLNNARRHTPDGTVVTVSARLVDDGARVELRVHDNGPGVPEALAGHEFERFSRGDSSRTRASGGAGLGLSIVQAVAAAHGGEARVDSKPGDTAFVLVLPVAPDGHSAPTG